MTENVNIPQVWQLKRQRDSQYAAAAHVFDFIDRCWAYCDEEGVDKQRLLDASRAWSHGESILVRAALDLFDPGCVAENGHASPNVGEIAGVLGPQFFAVYQQAMLVARAGIPSS